jgi:phage terminase large subunit-like protein
MRKNDREALLRWDDYRSNLLRSTPVPVENEKVRRERIAALEKDPEAWFAYYFPSYYTSEPARFHKRATNRLLKNTRWYEVRRWSRELAKSTRGMMEDIYMAMTGKAKNFILVSHTFDNAAELLMPYMINLESNNRLINDYGLQRGLRYWEIGKIVTRRGVAFRAIGAGQSPRGTRNEEKRPDVIRVDDIDTDERCRNERRIQETWQWVEQALLPTISISGNARIVFQGNLISNNSVIARASEKADHVDTINIRDKQGRSTWIEKNSEEHIDWVLSKISYISAQKEYFNNPIVEGTVFDKMHYKKLPPLSAYQFIVAYGDPSFRDTKKNDYKAVVVMGKRKDEYHIIKAYMGQTTTAEMAGWYLELNKWVNQKTPVYNFIEGNATQYFIIDQLRRYLADANANFYLSADMRKKADKFSRIETALEPLNRQGKLFLNLDEKDSPGMKVLEDQFLALDPSLSAHDDGPDAAEGAKYIIDRKIIAAMPLSIGMRQGNSKRY